MKITFLLALLILSGCVTTQNQTYIHYLESRGLQDPSSESFQHCHGYGCKIITDVHFDKKDWSKIDSVFKPAAQNAAQEREKISLAISQFETIVGARTGTHVDIYGTFKKLGSFQHDCVDESTNTTIYLTLLKKRELLKFHAPRRPDERFPIIHSGTWPHKTAVITEKETGLSFAVDSWFHNNGAPAEIVRLEKWKDGWKPNKK